MTYTHETTIEAVEMSDWGEGGPTAAPAGPAPTARPPLDLSVYLVTDTGQCASIGVPETVRRAVAAGVSVVQLRDPDVDDEGFIALGRQLVAVLLGTGVPLIVNDRVELVRAIGAQGAHVGQGDLDVVRARRLLGEEGYLGLSVHSLDELDDARVHLELIDYLGIGPLRPTLSKPDHRDVRGLAHLHQIAAASPWPCVAIGGVKAADAADLRAAGLEGMAVISAICGQTDIEGATREFVDAWAAAAPMEELR